jgi:hypothetical protein
MRLMYLGDIMGKVGRQAVIDLVPELRDRLLLSLVGKMQPTALVSQSRFVKLYSRLVSTSLRLEIMPGINGRSLITFQRNPVYCGL